MVLSTIVMIVVKLLYLSTCYIKYMYKPYTIVTVHSIEYMHYWI